MFCPKCATQNLDGASFCRTCGANISLVPQALTGQLAQQPPEESLVARRVRRRLREPSIDGAFRNIFMGIAFLIVAIALSRTIGETWWFWMLIPAFSMMGTGIAQYVRVKEKQKQPAFAAPPPAPPGLPQTAPSNLPRRTDELMPPAPSVTEGTTRHLGVEAPTRHLDPQDRK